MDTKINNINQYEQKSDNKIKWQQNYANWFIELIKKIFEKKLVLWKFQRILSKTILNGWFQFI